jgi:hypothetical protein
MVQVQVQACLGNLGVFTDVRMYGKVCDKNILIYKKNKTFRISIYNLRLNLFYFDFILRGIYFDLA